MESRKVCRFARTEKGAGAIIEFYLYVVRSRRKVLTKEIYTWNYQIVLHSSSQEVHGSTTTFERAGHRDAIVD